MRTITFYLAIAMTFISIQSCVNELDVLEATSEQTVETKSLLESEKQIFKFRYHGIEYAEEYEIIDSAMVFKNSFVTEMISDLENAPNSARLTYPNGFVEYFDSTQDMETYIDSLRAGTYSFVDWENPDPPFLLYTFKSASFAVYEDADFQGESIKYPVPTSVPDMRNATNIDNMVVIPRNFDDRISSFELGSVKQGFMSGQRYANVVVIFYADLNYTGRSASFILSVDDNTNKMSNNNFKSIKNMNDETTSLKAYFY